MSDSKLKAIYRGPSVHTRIISREDLVNGQWCENGDLPEKFQELKWDAEPGRRWMYLDGLPESVIDMLKEDPSFEVKDGDAVVGEADPDAGHVNAAGGSPGIPENPVLAEAIGWEPPETDSEDGETGGQQSFASASGDGDTVTTGGSSTAGR